MNGMKISRDHLSRKAIVYVRQSSDQQVKNNLESKERQYNLRNRAKLLGWDDQQCIVIDDDLGISGARAENRPGYQRLISMIALNEVGILLSIEISRLARNCLDWYQLLEVSSTFGVLIGDEDAVYDPSDFNDRLLLGLRGTISEVELQQIKNRMMRGRMNKAQRGDLEFRVPIGYERDHLGKISFTKDKSVRAAVSEVFRLFKSIRSVRGTLFEFCRRNYEIPYWSEEPGLCREIRWRKPVYDAINGIVKNEFYAGSYIYGKRKSSYNPISKKTIHRTVEPKDWDVYIPDHHPSYITLEEYRQNIASIKENSYGVSMSKGAPREGAALLQGIVYCAKCGRKMRPRYSDKKFYYCCDAEHRRRALPICGWASARRVDDRIQKAMLDVLNDGTVDLTFNILRQQKVEINAQKGALEKKLTRIQYEVNLARRRYESVDPENRLVASTLEEEWNDKLKQLEEVKNESTALNLKYDNDISAKKVKSTIGNLEGLWNSNRFSNSDKKEIIRTIIERVTLETSGNSLEARVYWYGGAISNFDIPKYLFSDFKIYEKITDLAKSITDKEIAAKLNQEGVKTHKGKTWTARRVMDFRLSNSIPSSFCQVSTQRLPNAGYSKSSELASLFNVNVTTIQKWFHWGLIDGHHAGGQSRLWVKASPKQIASLDGTAVIGPGANSVQKLAKTMGISFVDTITWAREKNHEVVRARRGQRYQYYVIPTSKTNNNSNVR